MGYGKRDGRRGEISWLGKIQLRWAIVKPIGSASVLIRYLHACQLPGFLQSAWVSGHEITIHGGYCRFEPRWG